MKFRIAAAFAIGVVLLGLLPWHLISPPAGGIFAILSGTISIGDLLICAGLSFAAGFLASAVCTPFGMQIGILAAPAGMAVWALRSAALSTVFQAAPAAQDRLAVYSSLRLEAFVWMAIVGCCCFGAIAADKIFKREPANLMDNIGAVFKLPDFAAIPIAVIATIFVGGLLINLIAGDISYPDAKLGRVVGQPANLQIAFAVLISFMICGFIMKYFIGVNFLWPAATSALLSYYSITMYIKKPIIEHLVNTWPAVFFANSIAAVLPVQMVAFACLGAVWGYWLAVRQHLWQKYES